jgi:UPF0755 protein
MSQLGLGMTEDDEDLWQQGSGPRRRRGGPAVLLAALVVAALVFAAGFFSIRWITAGEDFTGDGSGQVVVQVTKGETLRGIGEALTDAGVVRSVDAFTSAAAAEPRSKGIAPGGYLMRLGMSGEAAVAWMLDPASRDTSKVVVPEGLRMSQIVTAVAKATGLSDDAMQDALSRAPALGLPDGAEGVPEGYLFPATYEFPRGVSADEVVRTMIARSKQAAAEADLAHGAEALGLTPHQVLTVASLVQGESGIDDYPKVARVIYNRLAKDMKLQLDSTVNYGLGTSDLHLSAEQLASDTPYNTYVHAGLPPTPIGAPGQQAIEAALNPAKGKWLYFVTTDPAAGVTKFTADYDQFLRWKAQFQANSG